MSTQKSFIERSAQFEEEHMVATKIRESSSPPPPLIVSEETKKNYNYDISSNSDLNEDPKNPKITK